MKKEIIIQTKDGPQKTDAEIIGVFGIHPRFYHPYFPGPKRPGYDLTHLPTGFRIPVVIRLSKARALKFARIVNGLNCNLVFQDMKSPHYKEFAKQTKAVMTELDIPWG